MACISPVVLVNCMLTLAEQGYGEDKGFTSLLCTAASIDVVHIVSLFSICFSFVFSNGMIKILKKILKRHIKYIDQFANYFNSLSAKNFTFKSNKFFEREKMEKGILR